MNKFLKFISIFLICGFVGAGLVYSKGRTFIAEYASLKQQQADVKEVLEGLKIEKELIELTYESTPPATQNEDKAEYEQQLQDIEHRIEVTRRDLAAKTAEVESYGGPAKTAAVKLFKKFARLVLS